MVLVTMNHITKDVLIASEIAHCNAPCSVEILRGEPTDDLIAQKLGELTSGEYQGKVIRPEKTKLLGNGGAPCDAVVFYNESDFAPLVNELLGKGEQGLLALVNYFVLCGNGAEDEGWWENADTLVKLVRRFTVPEAKKIDALEKIVHHQSNVYEYQRWVVERAKAELAELQKKREPVPKAGEAEAPLSQPPAAKKTWFIKRIFKK